MKNNYKKIIFTILITSGFFTGLISTGYCQIQKFERLAAEIDKLAGLETDLSKKIDQKFQQLQKKSGQIAKLKAKESDNLISNRKLQTLLRDSKTLANELDLFESTRNVLKDSLKNRSEEILKLIDNELVTMFRETKVYPRDSKQYKDGAKRLSELYGFRLEYQQYVKSDFNAPVQLVAIEIKESDSKDILKTKIDLLKDQQDYLMSIKLVISDRLIKSREWAELTNLAGDLIEDIQIHQTRDEAIVTTNSKAATENVTFAGSRRTADDLVNLKSKSISTELLIPIEIANLFQLQPDQLEDQIKKLNDLQLLIQSRADSLAKIINKRQ